MPIALDDVRFNKISIIERCLKRVFQEFDADPELGTLMSGNYRLGDALGVSGSLGSSSNELRRQEV